MDSDFGFTGGGARGDWYVFRISIPKLRPSGRNTRERKRASALPLFWWPDRGLHSTKYNILIKQFTNRDCKSTYQHHRYASILAPPSCLGSCSPFPLPRQKRRLFQYAYRMECHWSYPLLLLRPQSQWFPAEISQLVEIQYVLCAISAGH